MYQLSQQSFSCRKHNKQLSILVVPKAEYICEDCAIFDPAYRHQCLLQKQSIPRTLQQISKLCDQIIGQQKIIGQESHKKMSSLMRSIQFVQVSFINHVNNQFMEVKSKVSELFIKEIQASLTVDQKYCRSKLTDLLRETSNQQRIKKRHQYQKELELLRLQMDKHIKRLIEVFENMKTQIEQKVSVNTNILSAFQPLLSPKLYQPQNQKITQVGFYHDDDNLLDFSEFNLCLAPILRNQSAMLAKKNKVQRMKTAACLEDSICSVASLTKSIESQALTIAITQIGHQDQNKTLLSERSICSSSTISKQSTLQSILTTKEIKESSKKFIIEITSLQELQVKLASISPTVKSIKISNLGLTSQDFLNLLKQKISKSFIHSLQIINCPKLTDKVLLDIKTHKCKTLKKLEFKDCKEINWNDKKVKEILKKLQIEGVKLNY